MMLSDDRKILRRVEMNIETARKTLDHAASILRELTEKTWATQKVGELLAISGLHTKQAELKLSREVELRDAKTQKVYDEAVRMKGAGGD